MVPSTELVKIEIKKKDEDDKIPTTNTDIELHVKMHKDDNNYNMKNKIKDKDKDKNKNKNKTIEILDQNSKISKEKKTKIVNSALSLEQKKANHILSENRRRNQIRSTFDKLVELVPYLEISENRSEYAILTKTANYIIELRKENERLEKLKLERGL